MTGATRDDAVAPALAARMKELLGARGGGAAGPPALLSAAIQGLEQLVRQPASAHTALDLLAIDALVTAAFAGTLDPKELEALAGDATARLLALGNLPPSA
ncbi:MAG: hypothetical protein ACT4P6_04375 [Gemmatimonadaceae bacterium]